MSLGPGQPRNVKVHSKSNCAALRCRQPDVAKAYLRWTSRIPRRWSWREPPAHTTGTSRPPPGAARCTGRTSAHSCLASGVRRVPPEIPHQSGRSRPGPLQLAEQDGDRAGGRGDVRCRSGAADPAVASRHVPRVDGLDVDRAAETSALTLQEQLAGIALGLGQLVGGHLPHRLGRQQPTAASDPAGEQHPGETVPVIDGRDQPACAGGTRGQAAPLPVGGGSTNSRPPAGPVR